MSEDISLFLFNLLTNALTFHDSQRDRSKQKEIGPSQLGSCARQVYYQLTNAPVVNETEKLPAILGTFIHEGIAKAITHGDPFGDNFLIEQKFNGHGLPMHTDLFIKDKGLVVDWKTKTKSSLRYFPSDGEIWQVQTYAHILKSNGYEPKTVALVVIPRDGKMSDIRIHVEPYDPVKAEAALAWRDDVVSKAESGDIPAPEKMKNYCAMYCDYFDVTGENGCASLRK